MVKLNARGLVPAIAQDANTGEVLMMGYVSPGSIKKSLASGQIWFYSRSREELWHKGSVSGNYLNLKEALVDCDGDTLLFKVEPTGPACHTGNRTCFFQSLEQPTKYESDEASDAILQELFSVIKDRQMDKPEDSYTASLFGQGPRRIAQKVVEEAGETAIAAVTEDKPQTVRELADLWYHSLVLLAALDLTPEVLWKELRSRRK